MFFISDLKFTIPFSVSYLRNNRSSGQKSLRCFPHCTEKGHIASGFCGDHLEATATIKKNAAFGSNWLEQITVVGEIRPFSDKGISSGTKVSRKKLLNELRDIRGGTKSGGELLLGEMKILHEDETSAVVMIAFNDEKHSWDYSWKSNRWSGVNNSHVVDVVLVESLTYTQEDANPESGKEELDVYSSACGDTFLILSSHKSPHLKRKLSAAAATAAEGEIAPTATDSTSISEPSAQIKISKRRSLLSSSDPMSALLMALGDGNHNMTDEGSLPLNQFSYTSESYAAQTDSNVAVCPLSATWEENSLLPPKRKRMKSVKMKEYSESIYDGEERDVLEDADRQPATEPTGRERSILVKNELVVEIQNVPRQSNYLGTMTGSSDALYSPINDVIEEIIEEDRDKYGDDDEYLEEGGGEEYEDEGEDIEQSSTAMRKRTFKPTYKTTDDDSPTSDGRSRGGADISSSKFNISKEDLQSADSKIFDLRWNETFVELVTYCETFGHGNVPKDYKSSGGRWLGKWLDFQRQMKKKNRLRSDRIARLEGLVSNGYLNMYDGPRRGHRLSGENVHQWEGWYNALLEYGEINGTYNVPRHYVIPPSTTSTSSVMLFNTVGRKLGRWLQTQRLRSRSGDLRGDRLKRLQELANTGRLDWLGKDVNPSNDKEKDIDLGANEGEDGEDSGLYIESMSSSSHTLCAPVSPTSKNEFGPRTDSPICEKILDTACVDGTIVRLSEHAKVGECRTDRLSVSPLVSHVVSAPMVKLKSGCEKRIGAVVSVGGVAAVASGLGGLRPGGEGPGLGQGLALGQGVVTVSAVLGGGFGCQGTGDVDPHSPLNLNGLEALLFAATSH